MSNLILINGGMGAGKSTISNSLLNDIKQPAYYLKMDDLKYSFHNIEDSHIKKHVFELSHLVTIQLLNNGFTVIVDKAMNKLEALEFIKIGDTAKAKVIPILLLCEIGAVMERIKVRRAMGGKEVSKEYMERVIKSHNVAQTLINLDSRQKVYNTEDMNVSELALALTRLL